MLNDYEILLMLDPDLPEERQTEIVTRARQLVEKGGGAWVRDDTWGRRKLAYEIQKKTDGVYHLLEFDAEPETLDELTRILKITDGVMRHLAVRRVHSVHGPARPPAEFTPEAPGRADREPDYAAANRRSPQRTEEEE